jgi:cytochrome c-type biogenesis protein CcmF
MLKVWNMVLVALAFLLSIFGTFLTRSGVVNSIHSFSQSPLGGWFLGFIVLCTVFTVTLIYLRLPLLRARTKLESLVSREATFLYNNLLLVALCLTILWGVMYPLLTEAVRGETRSVSKPYYNFFLHSFGLPLLLLMGIGPLVAWRRASLRALGRTFFIPFAVALVTGVALIAAGFASSLPGLLAYTFSAFAGAAIVLEFWRGTRATGSIVRLVGRNRRRYGGYLVHASILLFAIGVAGSSAYQTVGERGLLRGQGSRSPATRCGTTRSGRARSRTPSRRARRSTSRATARTSRRCTRVRTRTRWRRRPRTRWRSTTTRGTSATCS